MCHSTGAIDRQLFCTQIDSSKCVLIWNKAIGRITTKSHQKAQVFWIIYNLFWSLFLPRLDGNITFRETSFFYDFFVICHWRKRLSVINWAVKLNGLWCKLIFHIYIYPNIMFSTVDLRQKGQLLVFQLRSQCYMIRPIWQKNPCNFKSKAFIVLQRKGPE